MYPAKHYQSNAEDIEFLQKVIKQNPLATLVFNDINNMPNISHIPCHFNSGDDRYLVGHVSNNHPLAAQLKNVASNNVTLNLVFHGENAYISPNYVGTANSSAQLVPTWNYSAVHISGYAIEVVEHDEKHQQMRLTSEYFEQDQTSAWSLDYAPETAINHMLQAITIFKVEITDIQGRLKLSQNKSRNIKEEIAKNLADRGMQVIAQQMLELT